jgi:hypothetical protein
MKYLLTLESFREGNRQVEGFLHHWKENDISGKFTL